MAFADLVVRIAGDITSLDRATKTALSRIKSFGNDLQSLGASFAIGVSAPLAAFGGVALKSAADLEALRLGLTAVTGSAEKASRQFEDLKEVAKLPGLGLKEAVQGAINLQAVGFAADKTKTILSEFGNALASVGRGREDLNEVIRQLGQLSNRGKVTADNLKPIIERVPQVAAIINREFGTIDTETLQKLGISSEEFINVLIGGLSKLERVNGGLKNDFENLRDSIDIALAEAGAAIAPFAKQFIDGLAVPAIAKLKELAVAFRGLPQPVQDVVIQFGAFATAAPLVVLAIGNLITNLATISAAMKTAAAATGILGTAMSTLPFIAIAGGFALITKAVLDYTRSSDQAERAQRRLQAAQDTANEKSTEANTHFAQYDAFGRNIVKTHAELRDSLLAHVQAQSSSIEAVKQAAIEHPKYDAALNQSATVTKEFTNAVRGQTREAAVLAAMLGKLEGDYRRAIEAEAEARIQRLRGIELWKELPPVINDTGEATARFNEQLAEVPQRLTRTIPFFDAYRKALQDQILVMAEAEMKGRNMDPMYDRNAQSAQRATQAISKSAEVMRRQVSTITTDLSRALSDLAFEGGKLKDRLGEAFVSIGKSILRAAIEAQLQRIIGLVGKLLSSVPALGGVFGTVFGTGASAAGGAASAAGGAASAAGSVAGSVGGSVSSAISGGLLGYVGVGAQVASAVSSVISNFQFAAMNKSLDIIVKHTLQTANQLIYGLQPQVNQYLPYLELIHTRLVEQAAGGGGRGNTYNVYVNGASNPAEVAREVGRYLKAQGAF